MKKVTFLLILLLGIGLVQAKPTSANHNKFSIALGAGVRNFSGDTDDVYNLVNLTFCLDIGFRFARSFEVFLHTDFLTAKGNLTITDEETTITIIPIEAGGRFLMGKSNLCPYLGAGLGFYLINEENPIGTIDESSLGFFAEAGLKDPIEYQMPMIRQTQVNPDIGMTFASKRNTHLVFPKADRALTRLDVEAR